MILSQTSTATITLLQQQISTHLLTISTLLMPSQESLCSTGLLLCPIAPLSMYSTISLLTVALVQLLQTRQQQLVLISG
jgi:hypothetical protein